MSATTNEATAPYDPFEAADNPEIRNKTYFGHVTVDAYAVVLQRGSGPVNFDHFRHRLEDRRTQVKVSIQPLTGSRFMDPINREVLVESNEYAKIFHPSIRALDIKPRELSGRYVRAEMIPTREYIKKDGTPGTATCPKIIATYETEQDCRAAQDALFGHHDTAAEAAPAVSNGIAPAAPNGAGMSADGQRQLLEALWNASGKSDKQMAMLLSVTPQLKHLTLDSGEVKSVMGVF